MNPEYKAVYSPSENVGWVEQAELVWQAQWYNESSLNEDKYERGGFYETQDEAIEAAKRGKATQRFFCQLMDNDNLR